MFSRCCLLRVGYCALNVGACCYVLVWLLCGVWCSLLFCCLVGACWLSVVGVRWLLFVLWCCGGCLLSVVPRLRVLRVVVCFLDVD